MGSGMSKRGLERLDRAMTGFVERGDSAGVVTLVHRRGEEAHFATAGWRDRDAKVPMTRDTIFRIASMSKPVASVAVLMLLEEGRLRLGDAVERWLPELANRKVMRDVGGALDDVLPSPRSITVADLLTHQSGLGYDFTVIGPLVGAIQKSIGGGPFPALTPDEFMKRLGELPLFFAPGSRWNYGVSTDVLGVLVARVSGQSFPAFLQDRLFGPLGMTDSGFHVPADKIGRLAVSYWWDAKQSKLVVQEQPVGGRYATAPAFPSGGAGMVSTVDDYLRFALMLLGNGKTGRDRLLSRKTVELMTSNAVPRAVRNLPAVWRDLLTGRGFGLGVSVVDDMGAQDTLGSVGKYGWPGAYSTDWFNDPAEQMVGIMMTQMYFDEKREIRPTFENLVYQAIDD